MTDIIDSVMTALRKRHTFSEEQLPHDSEDMVYEAGNSADALLYSLLFVPAFSLVDDSVLLTNVSNEVRQNFLAAKREGKMSLDRLEASFNIREISFLFVNGRFEGDEEVLLANRVAEAWRRALAACYPGRRFKVQIVAASENVGDIAVEFHEIRS